MNPNKNPILPTIVIVGSPNTGKSSLFNRLIRKRKAIVEAIPGVTRNRLCANISIGKKEARLIDTEGIKVDLKDRLDELIYKQTEYSIKEADVVLFTCDARIGATPIDYHITSLLRKSSKRIFLL